MIDTQATLVRQRVNGGGWAGEVLRRKQPNETHYNRASTTIYPYLLIFLNDETPESLSWGAVASRLPNGKNDGIV